jgi:copper resistance protein D
MESTADLTTALVIARAVHFAASAIMAGTLLVDMMLVGPAALFPVLRTRFTRVVWIGLLAALLSGGAWFALEAANMSGQPLSEAIAPDVLHTVLMETRYGLAMATRAALAILLAVSLIGHRIAGARWLATGTALASLAAIAFTGHAGAEPGPIANLHLAADIFHLLAAGSWIGGLVALVMILAVCRRDGSEAGVSLARRATARFSTFGVVNVGVLVVTGFINAAVLVGTPNALATTTYGRLLLVKLGLFGVMLALATINREVLRPRLLAATSEQPRLAALRALTRNSIAEIVLGFAIFLVVGSLGIQHPAIHGMG